MSGQRLYSWPEMNALPPNSGGIGGMVQAARNAYCGVRQAAPWAVSGLFPDSPMGQLFTALGDKICNGPTPGAPPPEQPTWRGNCPIFYNVAYRWEQPANPNIPGPQTGTIQVQGPIRGGAYRSFTSDTVAWGVLGATSSSNPDGFNFVVSIGSSSSNRRGFYGVITGVTPLNAIPPGGCETVPPGRQWPQPFLPGDNDFVGPPVPTTPTPGPQPPTGGPIVFPPVIPVPIPVPVPVPFAPVFFVPVRIGPFDFNFDLGGVNIQLNGTVNVNTTVNVLPPGPPTGGRPPTYLPPAETEECVPCDLSGVIQQVSAARAAILTSIDNQTNILQPIEPAIQWTTPTPPLSSGQVALPLNAISVRVEFIDRPSNLKAQWGGGGAPDVTFAGWGFFGGANTDGGQRLPLDFEVTRVYVPPNATHFGFTAKEGRRATVSVGTVPAGSNNLKLGRNLLWQARV